MKNTLAIALATIEDIIAAQGGATTRFEGSAVAVTLTGEQGEEQCFIKTPTYDHVDDEDVAAMAKAGVLLNDGEVFKKRFGRSKAVFVLGIDMDALRRAVRKEEIATSQAASVQDQNTRLKRELRISRKENESDRAMADLIRTIEEQLLKGRMPPKPPALVAASMQPKERKALAGIPTLMLSDWHWGEKVTPEQVEGLNKFDLAIANRRADRIFNSSMDLLFHHMSGQHYDGIIVKLGGDMLSGNIHEELRQTNDAPIHECVLTLAEKLTTHLMCIAGQFNWIYVPGVVGNHGRIDRKPTAKNAVMDNYDWLVYELVRQYVTGRMGDKCNVYFDISESLDLAYQVYGTRYLFTHGDQIKGGSGVGGFWPSMMKTAARKQERSVASGGTGFDYMTCGHFHKYGTIENIIVNGSLKGYDEWVYKMNFRYEQPIQALWVTHPTMGIIDHRPVYGDPAPERDMDAPIILVSDQLKSMRKR